MKIALAAVAAALLLPGCAPPATTSTTTASSTTTTPAGFTINPLAENDANIQGCSTMLSRHGDTAGNIFVEDGVDTDAKGFIRINGALLNVDLIASNATEKGGTRTFADKAHTVTVVETLTTGEAHQESDSVEESGTIAVTFGGATQTIPVEGGTAC